MNFKRRRSIMYIGSRGGDLLAQQYTGRSIIEAANKQTNKTGKEKRSYQQTGV
jgi:hypothetical protein